MKRSQGRPGGAGPGCAGEHVPRREAPRGLLVHVGLGHVRRGEALAAAEVEGVEPRLPLRVHLEGVGENAVGRNKAGCWEVCTGKRIATGVSGVYSNCGYCHFDVIFINFQEYGEHRAHVEAL